MNHKQIERIVQKVFEKAKKGSVSHSKYALAKQVVKEIKALNPKTIERAYSRYIEKKEAISSPNPETIAFFCKYIGYNDYEAYMSENSKHKIIHTSKKKSKEKKAGDSGKNGKIKKKYTWSLTLKVVIVLGAIIGNANQFIRKKIQLLIAPLSE